MSSAYIDDEHFHTVLVGELEPVPSRLDLSVKSRSD